MTAGVAVGSAKFDIGEVVGETFAVTRRNIVTFGLLALLLGVLPSILVGFLSLSLGAADANNSSANIIVSLTGIVLQAAVIYVVVGEQVGRKVTLGQSLSRGGLLFLPMFGIGLIAGIGTVLGLVLLVVPGLILATAWSVAGPARVIEGPGVSKALQRSWDLTRGNRLRVFALFLLVWGAVLLVAVAAGAALGLAGFFGQTPTAADVVAEGVVTGLVTALPSVFTAVAYLELRRLKEGPGTESLAEIFS
jgi:hypothetical protein